MFTEEWVSSPNWGSRQGHSILAIVDHITAGLMPGCLSWLQNPVSKASSHYLITRDGRILQLVREVNAAWHAGIVHRPDWPLFDGTNPNRYTIGIEHEGQPNEPLTEVQYEASLFLHKELTAKYRIPIDNNHIVGHYRIDSVNKPNCPGPLFPWERLFKDLRGEGVNTLAETSHDPDVNLIVWVRTSLVKDAIKQINALGFAATTLPLDLNKLNRGSYPINGKE